MQRQNLHVIALKAICLIGRTGIDAVSYTHLARGHLNQRQIDVIQQEVLPRLHQQNFQSIGIITPYRDQVTAIRKQLGDTYEVDTVHKFQGREQDAIILTSVDNVITDFVDDPHMLNVAVSRAVHSLAVVTSQDPRNDQTNYGDLTRYIEYNNFEVIQSQVYSVFDMLYHGYAEQRRAYLQKHKRVSEYDSENLMYSVIQEVLAEEAFSSIGCAVHVSLATLVKNYKSLTEGERQYARNPLTHVDFLLFNQMDKQPVLAIEVDGTGFHEAGSKQAERDLSLIHISYIGFTGPPISTKDRITREVFGDYIDIYDMTQAVEDGATRPVYYESRVIHLKLDENTLHLIDNEYDIMADNADPMWRTSTPPSMMF